MVRIDNAIRQAVEQVPRGVVVLKFSDVHEEFGIFKGVVADRLTPASLKIIDGLMSFLEQVASAASGRRVKWATEDSLETLPSKGRHQVARAGRGRSLKGVISFVWEIEPCGMPNRKRPMNRAFAVRNSSVRISLEDADSSASVACWDFDVGDDRSPGCHVHVKYAPTIGSERESLRDVDVPRLPSIIMMPTDALEFVLGELWQEDWYRFASSTRPDLNAWRRFPRQRMISLLEWYLREVQASRGTPWSHLKQAKPDHFFLWTE